MSIESRKSVGQRNNQVGLRYTRYCTSMQYAFWESGHRFVCTPCSALIFTARIRRMRESNIFSLFTLAGVGWGVPHLRSGWGGGEVTVFQVWTGGYPIQGPDRGGIPHLKFGWGGYLILLMGGGTPSKIRTGGIPPSAVWVTPHPVLDGVPLPPSQDTDQHSEHLLRGAVCLLLSRRRTFLL